MTTQPPRVHLRTMAATRDCYRCVGRSLPGGLREKVIEKSGVSGFDWAEGI